MIFIYHGKGLDSMRIRTIGRIALFGTLIIPLVITPWAEWPFITGKAEVFRWLVGLALISAILANMSARQIASNRILMLLAISAAISDALSADPRLAFLGSPERSDGCIGLAFSVSFVFAAQALFDERDKRRYLIGMACVSVCVSSITLLQIYHQPGVRPYSTLGNPDYLATYLLLSAFIAADLGGAWWAVVAADIAAMAATLALGPVVGLVAGLSVIGWQKHRRAFLIAVAVIPLSMAVAVKIPTGKESLLVQRIAIKLHGGDERPLIWARTAHIVSMRPGLGWGHEGMIHAPTGLITSDGSRGPLDRAHNLILDWLVEGGCIGLLIRLALIYALWRTNRGHPWRQAMIAAWMAQGMFTFDTLASAMPIWVLLAFG